MKKIYLDYAATTPVDSEVLKSMQPFFSEKFGNASSLHSFGQEAKRALEDSRSTAARLIGAENNEIIFTSSGTESDNLAIKGIVMERKEKGKHIITSPIEHDAIINTFKWLKTQGYEITFLPVDKYGSVNPDDVANSIRKDTVLVSLMHANNEIGTIEPIEKVGKICHDNDIIFHTDAVQTFGKLPIDVNKMNIDLLTASSHKIYGPKGVGLLYLRNGVTISPLIHGGGHEFGLRASTENIPGVVGFAKAIELRQKEMDEEAKRLTKLRDYTIENILKIEDSHLNGHPTERLPNNVNTWFEFIEGEGIILHLDSHGIAASTGSACSSKSLKPSHVLLAIGLKHEQAHGSLRVTSGKYTTKEDIDYALEVLPPIINRLRELSPFKKGEIKNVQ